MKEVPAVVILDLMLPDTSGKKCVRTLKTSAISYYHAHSKSSEEERVAGFALGADDYVVKPFSPRELVYRVRAVLKGQRKKIWLPQYR